jgi:hypothetical protein
MEQQFKDLEVQPQMDIDATIQQVSGETQQQMSTVATVQESARRAIVYSYLNARDVVRTGRVEKNADFSDLYTYLFYGEWACRREHSRMRCLIPTMYNVDGMILLGGKLGEFLRSKVNFNSFLKIMFYLLGRPGSIIYYRSYSLREHALAKDASRFFGAFSFLLDMNSGNLCSGGIRDAEGGWHRDLSLSMGNIMRNLSNEFTSTRLRLGSGLVMEYRKGVQLATFKGLNWREDAIMYSGCSHSWYAGTGIEALMEYDDLIGYLAEGIDRRLVHCLVQSISILGYTFLKPQNIFINVAFGQYTNLVIANAERCRHGRFECGMAQANIFLKLGKVYYDFQLLCGEEFDVAYMNDCAIVSMKGRDVALYRGKAVRLVRSSFTHSKRRVWELGRLGDDHRDQVAAVMRQYFNNGVGCDDCVDSERELLD